MAANLTINGTSYDHICAGLAGAGVAGTYYSTEPFSPSPMAHSPQYEDQMITFPGIDGVGRKRFGFRGRRITCHLVAIDTTKAGCETKKETAFSNANGLARFSVTMPGGSAMQGCTLGRDGGSVTNWMTIGPGLIACFFTMELVQMSETN